MKPDDPDYRPARGYTWEPFKPGHTLSMRHGAYSPRRVDPVAAELVEYAVEVAPYLADPGYALALHAWADAEARAQLLRAYVDEHGLLDEKGRPRPCVGDLHRFERRAAEARTRLGLDPLSRAKLGKDVTGAQVDLARLMAQAAHMVEASGDPVGPPPAGPQPGSGTLSPECGDEDDDGGGS